MTSQFTKLPKWLRICHGQCFKKFRKSIQTQQFTELCVFFKDVHVYCIWSVFSHPGRSVMLEFPKTVTTGSNVTLRCKTRDGSVQTGYLFFRNGSFIGAGLSGEFTITDVQRSDEGFYSCSTGLFLQSSKSWLRVRGQGTTFFFPFMIFVILRLWSKTWTNLLTW